MSNYGKPIIATASTASDIIVYIRNKSSDTSWKDTTTFFPILIDLTQMFGAGNEPSTYEEFVARKPQVADEYTYNEGEVINFTAESIGVTGRNLFKGDWQKGVVNSAGKIVATNNYSYVLMNVIPETQYYFNIPNNQYFEIYYSMDGLSFTKLVNVVNTDILKASYSEKVSLLQTCFQIDINQFVGT